MILELKCIKCENCKYYEDWYCYLTHQQTRPCDYCGWGTEKSESEEESEEKV